MAIRRIRPRVWGAVGPLTATATTKSGARSWPLEFSHKLIKRMAGKREQTFFAEEKDGTLRLGNFASWQAWSESASVSSLVGP